jgi:hypothetical protein
LVIAPVNDPPVAAPNTVRYFVGWNRPVEVDLSEAFDDVENDPLYYTVVLGVEGAVTVEWASDDPTESVLIISQLDQDWYGYIYFNVTCYDRDPVGSAEQPGIATWQFLLEVERVHGPPNRPPTVPSIEANRTEIVEGDRVMFEAKGAVDPEGKVLSFKWTLNGTDILDWSSSSTFNHTFSKAGEYNITVSVRDVEGLIIDTSVSVTVLQKASDEPPINEPDPDPGLSSASIIVGLIIIAVVLVSSWFIYTREEA